MALPAESTEAYHGGVLVRAPALSRRPRGSLRLRREARLAYALLTPTLLVILFLGFWLVQDPAGFAVSAKQTGTALWDLLVKLFDGVISFLVGQLMQKAGGAANPKVAQELLRERLQG